MAHPIHTEAERNVLLYLADCLSAAIEARRVQGYPKPPGYRVGEIQSWGCWLNWCPVEGHLWSSVGPRAAQWGDGITACPDHDDLPNSESPEPQYAV